MDAFTLLLVLAIVAVLAIVGVGVVLGAGALGVAAATSASEDDRDEGQAWVATWQGHEIVLQTRSGEHSLSIDGRLVAQQTSSEGATLEGRIDAAPVIGSIQKGSGVKASLHVDGAPVSMQRRPYGTAMASAPSSSTIGSGAKVPEDPRWAAIEKLVAQVSAQGGEVAALADESQAELRTLLLKIDEAEEANASHQQLAGREDERLRRLIDQHEVQVGRLIDALRELHVGTVEKSAGPDESARLLAALEIELAQRNQG